MADTKLQVIDVEFMKKYTTQSMAKMDAKDSVLRTELLAAIGKINTFDIEVVEALPATEAAKEHVIYLVKPIPESTNAQNVYNEYVFINGKFELLGDTKVDLENLKTEITDAIQSQYVKSVDTTTTTATEGAVTSTTSTLSFKNQKGEEIDSEKIVAVTAITDATVTDSGLMSAEDKVKLDGLGSSDVYDGKYANQLALTKGEAVVAGSTSTVTNTVDLKNPKDTVLSTITFDTVTYGNMKGATDSAAGTAGLVPAPAAGKQLSFLRGDGTWVVPTNTTYPVATNKVNGLMSAADKTKLDSFEILGGGTDTDEIIAGMFA